ncbi:hypothetical protein [Streptococcus phage phi-SsuNJ5_rum]|nr:hypothetical protein [Streptococcus phage phi-SsuNJ2_rum]QGJ86266.1 hypothetical protein [Streptococcus phage phi-SsuNJ5_rum]
MENYPLYCPKCRQESLSNLANYKFLRDKTYKTCTDIVG